MRRRTTIVLAALAWAFACTLLLSLPFREGATPPIEPYGEIREHAGRGASVTPTGMRDEFKSPTAGVESADGTMSAIPDTQQSGPDTRIGVRFPVDGIPTLQRLIVDSEPRVRSLFETGLDYMGRGKFTEARLAFQTLIRTYEGSPLDAPAYFAVGVSYYREGGIENFMLAEDQFMNYLIFFGKDKDLQEFAEAAQMNLAAAAIRIMRSTPSEKDRAAASLTAAKALTAFIETWPESSYAQAARVALAEVQKPAP